MGRGDKMEGIVLYEERNTPAEEGTNYRRGYVTTLSGRGYLTTLSGRGARNTITCVTCLKNPFRHLGW